MVEEKEVAEINQKEAPMPVTRDGVTFLRVSEAAERLGVHRNTVIYWIKQDQIEYERLGAAEKSHYLIPLSVVEKLLEQEHNGAN